MINFKNIIKVLLLAMFICALSGEVRAQNGVLRLEYQNNQSSNKSEFVQASEKQDENLRNAIKDGKTFVQVRKENDQIMYDAGREVGKKNGPIACNPACKDDENCSNGKCIKVQTSGGGGEVSANFCSGDFGIFSELVKTGQLLFQRLRDLIYVVAGFGIIAVAVGGFFGNLNWKWLGAIVISLVVISTAGELIVLITGCEQFGSTLITNTLNNPTAMASADYQGTYTEDAPEEGLIQWNDAYAIRNPETYAGTKAVASAEEYDDRFLEGYDKTADEIKISGKAEGKIIKDPTEISDHGEDY